ncbi:MFS-type transporter [Apiospora arundinis]
MHSLFSRPMAAIFFLLSFLALQVLAQNDDGYIGYDLHKRGDPDSAIYETANTKGGVLLPEEPDVRLNASVSVGEIDIEVDNLTAKVNLDAKVLSLLHFTAGVDLSIDRVKLSIQNVSAKVYLEARLENVVAMVDDVLSSIDLNPIIATLGKDVKKIVGNVTDTIGGGGSSGGGKGGGSGTSSSAAPSASASGNAKRALSALDYNIAHNILYSTNDYSGNTHANRVLGQNGTIYDSYVNNEGHEVRRENVGFYAQDMQFTGHNRTITIDGKTEYEMGYHYAPYPGLEVYAAIWMDPIGRIVKTKIVSEAEAGGTSTVSSEVYEEIKKREAKKHQS